MSASRQTAPPDSAPDTWFLKTGDGSVFGPVEMAELHAWAEDGRIVPGCLVSTDGRKWIAAESLPDLRMDWTVELPDASTYGPLNLHALADLFKDGSIRAEARVINILSNETSTVHEMQDFIFGLQAEPQGHVDPAGPAELDSLRRERDEFLARLRQAEATLSRLEVAEEDTEVDWISGRRMLKGTVYRSLRESKDDLENDLATARQELEDLRRDFEESRKRWRAELTRLSQELRRARGTADEFRRKRKDIAAAHHRAEQVLQQDLIREKQQRSLLRGMVRKLEEDSLGSPSSQQARGRLEAEVRRLNAACAEATQKLRRSENLLQRQAGELASPRRQTERATPERDPATAGAGGSRATQSDTPLPAAALASLEAQAEREIRAWKESRGPAPGPRRFNTKESAPPGPD